MARYSTGTAVADGVYTTLFESTFSSPSSGTGPSFWGLHLWVTAGTATIKINGDVWTVAASTDTVHKYKLSKGPSDTIYKVEAAGSGGAATVCFEEYA